MCVHMDSVVKGHVLCNSMYSRALVEESLVI